MGYVWLGVVVAIAVVAGWWLTRRAAVGAQAVAGPPADNSKVPEAAPTPSPPPVMPTQWRMPDELVGFRRVEVFELPAQAARDLATRLVRIPRPPQGLHELLSPGMLESATVERLSELILAEAPVAAKVLATVNSPFYGLQNPVTSVAQGISYLGMDTVRGIALQYLMSETLRPSDPALKAVFERWWQASAIASQLCLRLGQRVGVPDPGAMVTGVVLSFLGHMAALTLLPPAETLHNAEQDFLARTEREQASLGLCAGELGCLLLSEWNMPPLIVEEVRAIDRVLTTPPKQFDAARGMRTALAYYCARVAEKLACGTWTDLAAAAPETLRGPEFFHLQTHFMIHPRLSRLAADFRDPAFTAEVQAMVQAVRTGHAG